MKKEYWQLMVRYFIVFFLFGQLILVWIVNATIDIRMGQGQMLAQTTINQMNLVMMDQMEKTETLKAFLKASGEQMMDDMLHCGDGSVHLDEFNCIAAQLQDATGVRALQLLPGGVVRYTYPYESNKEAIGDDVLHRSTRKEDAIKAKESGKMVVSGPLDLMQGGLALIGRNPIYYDDGTFWGFSAVVLDLPDILVPFGLDGLREQGYEYRLIVGEGETERQIASTMSSRHKNPAMGEITMFGQTWTLSVIPTSGWYSIYIIWILMGGVTLLAVILAAALAYAHVSSLRMKQALQQEREAREAAVHAYEAAKIANASKSTFLSTMSHDIRTPMNAIVGLCTLLERDAGCKERVLDHTKKITASSQHLLGLINDILDMSKIESGKTTLVLEEFSLAKVIEECNTILQPQVHAKHQQLVMDVQDIVHENLIGDKLKLNQIMLNLLSNAVKYTPNGGRISLLVKEITKKSYTIGEFQFVIKDTGIGMTSEFLKDIFEPFCRATDGRIDKIQGTGLGMTITKNLIDLMGGSIEISSELNQGTEIIVTLAFRLPKEEETAEFFRNVGIRRMLVVDDDPLVCDSVVTAMTGTEVLVSCSNDGEKALEQFFAADEKGEPFDILLLDWKMPNKSGYEIARMIHQQKPELPILILTAYDWSEVEEESQICGISGILTKPFFLSNFIRAVEQIHETSNAVSSHACPLQGLRILAAEDNRINGEILVELLTMCGAECVLCTDGQQAVQKFQEAEPGTYDLILMDVQMPIMDGLTATKEIRNSDHADAKRIPILAMTANAFAEDRKASQDAGMNGHLSKPIDLALLKKAIEDLLQ